MSNTDQELRRALKSAHCQCTGEAGDSCCDCHCIDPDIVRESECPDRAKHEAKVFRASRIRAAEKAVLDAAEEWDETYGSQRTPFAAGRRMALHAAIEALREARKP